MNSHRVPAPPAGTGVAGRRLWRAVLADYELHEHELTLLRQAVRVADVCDELHGVVEREGAPPHRHTGTARNYLP